MKEEIKKLTPLSAEEMRDLRNKLFAQRFGRLSVHQRIGRVHEVPGLNDERIPLRDLMSDQK